MIIPKVRPAVPSSFGLSECLDQPKPQACAYSWNWDEKMERAPLTPPVKSAKVLQPRDAKASPDHTAADVAHFLRESRPPQFDFTELESPTKLAPSDKLKRVLKLGRERSHDTSREPRSENLKLDNVIEKTSIDG